MHKLKIKINNKFNKNKGREIYAFVIWIGQSPSKSSAIKDESDESSRPVCDKSLTIVKPDSSSVDIEPYKYIGYIKKSVGGSMGKRDIYYDARIIDGDNSSTGEYKAERVPEREIVYLPKCGNDNESWKCVKSNK